MLFYTLTVRIKIVIGWLVNWLIDFAAKNYTRSGSFEKAFEVDQFLSSKLS